MTKSLTLILGGARSGKSTFAEKLASSASKVLFVATAEALDQDMASRIEAHQRARAATWRTLEEPRALESALPKAAQGCDLVLIDCLTLWVSNLLLQEAPKMADDGIQLRAEALRATYHGGSASWVVVSNEVGLGVVPPTALGRRYRDVLGRVNQAFATEADHVYLLVAGLALDLKAAGARPWQALLDQRP